METLEEYMDALSKFKYKCFGFPSFMMFFNPVTGSWEACFRNPEEFSNPDNTGTSPLDACKGMVEFLTEKGLWKVEE